jgi:hypothetical protein
LDAHRFDNLVKSLHTRRSFVGLIAGFGALLGVGLDDEAAAKKCKKKCGPCKRCKKGKCKPKPGSPSCGRCSVCRAGECTALCSAAECFGDGDEARCFFTCDPPCHTCSQCNQNTGQCDPLCPQDDCIDDFCRFQCEPPCGDCSNCIRGTCFALCPDGVACVDNLCQTPCSPNCPAGKGCIGGECFPVCDPPCADDEGCVAGSGGNVCVDLAGDCPVGPHDACREPGGLACSANGIIGGPCVTLPGGADYCSQGTSCSACESDLDCQSDGWGPNSRCVSECPGCSGVGGSGCIRFRGDPD